MHVYKNDVLVSEIVVRVILWVIFIYMELCTPFVRFIQPEEVWLYKYPRSSQYVSAKLLWLIVLSVPMALLTLDYLKNRSRSQYRNGILCLTLLLGLNGFVTMFVKLIVGRPRPDFLLQMFSDGIGNDEMDCTGDKQTIMEGRKSFPSGHASFAFSSMVFCALFLNGKLQPFGRNRAEAWRLICCMLPLLLATAIAVSRTATIIIIGKMLQLELYWEVASRRLLQTILHDARDLHGRTVAALQRSVGLVSTYDRSDGPAS